MLKNPIHTITTAVTHPVHTATSTAGWAVGEATSVVTTGVRIARRVTGTAISRTGGLVGRHVGPLVSEAEQPPAEQPPAEQPRVQQPLAEQPPVEQPLVQQPEVEQPQAQQQPVEQPPAMPTSDRVVEPEEVLTPSGIPAADVGTNPDTGETDLLQPGTEPLMDPSTTKAVKSETDTLRKAAERDKE